MVEYTKKRKESIRRWKCFLSLYIGFNSSYCERGHLTDFHKGWRSERREFWTFKGRGGESPLEVKWNINLIKPGYEYRGMKIEAMASMAHAIKNLPAMQETCVWSRGQRDDLPGRSLGAGYGNPLQYFCQENPMDRGACWATVRGVAKSQTGLRD